MRGRPAPTINGTVATACGYDLPGGERLYAEAIYRYATVDMTADEIHQLGLDTLAALQNELRVIGARLQDVAADAQLAEQVCAWQRERVFRDLPPAMGLPATSVTFV